MSAKQELIDAITSQVLEGGSYDAVSSACRTTNYLASQVKESPEIRAELAARYINYINDEVKLSEADAQQIIDTVDRNAGAISAWHDDPEMDTNDRRAWLMAIAVINLEQGVDTIDKIRPDAPTVIERMESGEIDLPTRDDLRTMGVRIEDDPEPGSAKQELLDAIEHQIVLGENRETVENACRDSGYLKDTPTIAADYTIEEAMADQGIREALADPLRDYVASITEQQAQQIVDTAHRNQGAIHMTHNGQLFADADSLSGNIDQWLMAEAVTDLAWGRRQLDEIHPDAPTLENKSIARMSADDDKVAEVIGETIDELRGKFDTSEIVPALGRLAEALCDLSDTVPREGSPAEFERLENEAIARGTAQDGEIGEVLGRAATRLIRDDYIPYTTIALELFERADKLAPSLATTAAAERLDGPAEKRMYQG